MLFDFIILFLFEFKFFYYDKLCQKIMIMCLNTNKLMIIN